MCYIIGMKKKITGDIMSMTCVKCGREKQESDFRHYMNRGVPLIRRECKKCESLAAMKRMGVGNHEDEEFADDRDTILGKLVEALIQMARHEYQRISKISSRQFYDMHDQSREMCRKHGIHYGDIERIAKKKLSDTYGLDYDSERELKAGTYLIVGDSHGKHTQHKTFDLLKKLQKYFNFRNIIHVGHLLDDDNTISYRWNDFDNVMIVPKRCEVKEIVSRNDEFGFEIVHERAYAGNLDIRTQDYYTNEYTDTSIGNINQNLNHRHTLMNFHRHEMDSKNTRKGESLIYMSPGCLCENFVTQVRLVKDWVGGGQTKEAWTTGMVTYQRRQEMMKLWERGVVILHVDSRGGYTPVMCRIYDIDKDECGIGYMGRVITNRRICGAEQMDLITADMQVPLHNPETLSIIDSVASRYNFKNHINLGDVCSNISVNHHDLGKGRIIDCANTSLLWESAYTAYILERTCGWAEHSYLIYANHERFLEDFYGRYPQFKEIFDIRLLYNLDRLGINLVPLKEHIEIKNALYVHGDLKHYGLSGKTADKNAKNFDASRHPVVIGHVHYSSIRAGCYSIGFAGGFDQKYNEVDSSRWNAGFGTATSWKGRTWISTIPILSNRLLLDGHSYSPSNTGRWIMKGFKADMKYCFQ